MTTQVGLTEFIHEISNLLEEVGMEVKLGKEETGKGRGWVVLVRLYQPYLTSSLGVFRLLTKWVTVLSTAQVNNDPNDVALYATDLTPVEIAYYREVVRPVFVYPEGLSV